MERVIYKRLLPIFESGKGLLKSQHGFPHAHSTVDARSMMVNLRALAHIGFSGYLARLFENYLPDRALLYWMDDGPKYYIVTRDTTGHRGWMMVPNSISSQGIPQGLVLVPLLWNV